MQELEFILNGCETKRFHTHPTLKEDRVDSHSFRVAMIYSLMASDHAPEPDAPVSLGPAGLMMCLTHDLAEWKMGDLPAPTKRNMPAIYDEENFLKRTFREVWGAMESELLMENYLYWEGTCHPMELRWFKLADAMDGALYCIRERLMGNKLIETCYGNFRKYISDVLADSGRQTQPMEERIIQYIDDMWEQANGTV